MKRADATAYVALACLEPWLPALHQLRPTNGDMDGRRLAHAKGLPVAWFDGCALFEASEPQECLDRVCEALSLLALVAHGDMKVWKTVMLEIWTENKSLHKWIQGELADTKLEMGFAVFDLRVSYVQHLARLSDHITRAAGRRPSEEYKEVREFLRHTFSLQCDEEDAGMKVRARIELDCVWDRHKGISSETPAEMLQSALEVVKSEASAKAEGKRTGAAPRFMVTNVDFSTGIGVKIGMDSLRCMQELVHHGIALSHLPSLTQQPTPEELPEFVQALRDLVGLDDDGLASVETISINDSYSSWPLIRAVLTAAQHSSNVERIELDVGEGEEARELRDYQERGGFFDESEDEEGYRETNGLESENGDESAELEHVDREDDVDEDDTGDASEDDEEDEDYEEDDEVDEDDDEYEDWLDKQDRDQSDLWQWIAFTLFSRHADHNIRTLDLTAEDLQPSEVEAIRRVLNAPNPYAVVRGRPGVMPRSFVPRQLVASRFVLEYPTDDVTDPPFMAKKPIAVRILETPDKGVFPWYQVLLPGYGDAWVHEDDVVSKSEDDLHLHNRQNTELPEFPDIEIMSMSDESMDLVADLIELIGHGTTRIQYLEHMGDRGFEDWCNQVVKACPKLEVLSMDGAFLDNLNIFEAAARAGYCRLRELSSPSSVIGSNGQHVREFFNALSDQSHPLTAYLRR